MNINKGLPKWRFNMMLEHYYEFLFEVYREMGLKDGVNYLMILQESIDYLEHQVNNFPELYQTTEIVDYKTKIQNLVKPNKVYIRPTYRLDRSIFKDDFYWPTTPPLHLNSERYKVIEKIPHVVRTKTCRRCGQVKEFYQFTKSAHTKDGLTEKCKECNFTVRSENKLKRQKQRI